MTDPTFRIEMEVRDYECDMEGIVNNAVYMNYIEHARHGFLRSKGSDFGSFISKGIYLVVIRIEADYLFPLRNSDQFYVTTTTESISKLRFGFQQNIFRLPDDKPILKAKVIVTSTNADGRPKYYGEVEKLLLS